GPRMVNWCPRCQTTLADIEVEHEERSGHLWHIKYPPMRSEEHTSELQSPYDLVCRLLLEKKKKKKKNINKKTKKNKRNITPMYIVYAFVSHLFILYSLFYFFIFFFFNDTATSEIYTLSLHDALPISVHVWSIGAHGARRHWRISKSNMKNGPGTYGISNIRQ